MFENHEKSSPPSTDPEVRPVVYQDAGLSKLYLATNTQGTVVYVCVMFLLGHCLEKSQVLS